MVIFTPFQFKIPHDIKKDLLRTVSVVVAEGFQLIETSKQIIKDIQAK